MLFDMMLSFCIYDLKVRLYLNYRHCHPMHTPFVKTEGYTKFNKFNLPSFWRTRL